MEGGELLSSVTPRLDGRPFRWTVGTRAVSASQWLSIDEQRHRLMAAKDRVLDADTDGSVITTAPGQEASVELLQCVLEHLQRFHTSTHSVTDQGIVDLDSDRCTAIDMNNPLLTIARALPDDFCVLTLDDEQSWTMTAAAVCFTSRWNLAGKVGLNLNEIHQPVPGYEDKVAGAVNHLINRLGTDQILRRSNWTLLDTDELHLPEPPDSTAPAEDVWDLKWLRIERQCLRRLPVTEAVIFTIDTRVYRVDELDPAARRSLHEAVKAAPRDIAAYKGWPIQSAGQKRD